MLLVSVIPKFNINLASVIPKFNMNLVNTIPKFNIWANLLINKMCDRLGMQASRLRFFVAEIASYRCRFIALIFTTCYACCTVYVQYMYSMCTLPKRTNTVHILYIYCTTGGEGALKLYRLVVYEVCCSVVRHSVSPCATAAYGVPFSGLWGCKRRLRGPILQDFSLRRLFFCYSRPNLNNMRKFYLLYPICRTSDKLSWSHICELITVDDPQEREFYFLTGITSNWPGINRKFSERECP